MSKTAVKPPADEPAKPTTTESFRETVDSIVIAFVLAFLFRTFEAEAFVIPTGSMALTLMGDHKDLNCTRCGYSYRVSASDESPNSPGEQRAYDRNPGPWRHDHAVTSGVCPNCRYRMHFDDERPETADVSMPPSYKGDRILVTKYSYDFADPQRWDVAVFKNPSQAKINYIKRIVGLPNEEVLIYRGDVYTRYGDADAFQIARKPHDKFLAVAQTVYDHDFALPVLHQRGWPQRWTSGVVEGSGGWKQSDDLKRFHVEAGKDEQWLRYQHYVPNGIDWRTLAREPLSPEQRARLKPQLISDFCEYNSQWTRIPDPFSRDYSYLGWHWVGDVGIECELTFGESHSDDAEAVLEIVEGGRAYQCRIRAATGDVVLSISGVDLFNPTARGVAAGAGTKRVRFANVDDRLLVWLNEQPVTFDASTEFQTLDTVKAVIDGREQTLAFSGQQGAPPLLNILPTRQDVRSPIGVAARNCRLEAAHLRVLRDVYYIADKYRGNRAGPVHDYADDTLRSFFNEFSRRSLLPAMAEDPELEQRQIASFMSDVDLQPERFGNTLFVRFPMQDDQFFVLGDNSPRSLDGRLWRPDETFVRRELLIGKALFVYWPHALDQIPGTSIPFPFFPNFARMRMIR